MFHRMKRYAAVLAAAVVLTGTASVGTASAATAAAAAPRPHCTIGTWLGPCHCPRGWHVTDSAWTFHCARNRKG